ncbi:hypothetical protein SAMN05192588_1840 [Nonlabens sp. Hel1_33_55]|uniref:hypothetical protein n=1 Tax=Nonlabens sp. Hel1_33_55 TaxID=1336802 RepID=UPI000875DE62|nr:hypothetical protein [Nonlabens sp. Hel1_33_55]SCY24344.1 hypothetical protein SAMN05192588_1840 [Nonlabens sp. Hel1_33_55]
MKKILLVGFLLLAAGHIVQAQDNEKQPQEEASLNFLDRIDTTRTTREVRTEVHGVFGIGWNQALGDENGIGEDYRFWGSGIWELGLEFSTQPSKSDDLIRFNYGLALQWQTLRINGNRQFVTNNDVTTLEPLGFNVDKSKFEQFTLIAPLHLEIGRGKRKIYKDDISRIDYDDSFVVGIGGYLGVNGTTSQMIKYEREGRDVTNRLYNDFETEDFVYGLSAYAGLGDFQIFFKYGLNSIFKNSPIDQRQVSIGFRFR